MSTVNQSIEQDEDENYVLITAAVDAGLISAGTSTSIVESDTPPDSEMVGHAMVSGKGKRYSLYTGRLYIKASKYTPLTVTVTED